MYRRNFRQCLSQTAIISSSTTSVMPGGCSLNPSSLDHYQLFSTTQVSNLRRLVSNLYIFVPYLLLIASICSVSLRNAATSTSSSLVVCPLVFTTTTSMHYSVSLIKLKNGPSHWGRIMALISTRGSHTATASIWDRLSFLTSTDTGLRPRIRRKAGLLRRTMKTPELVVSLIYSLWNFNLTSHLDPR